MNGLIGMSDTETEDQIDLGPEVPDYGVAPIEPRSVGPVAPWGNGLRPPPVVAITADNTSPNQDAQVLQAAQGARVPGATYTLGIPAETPLSPSYQARRAKQEKDFLRSTYEHATSVAQAVKDVAEARRLMGIMRMKDAQDAGMDPREAAYKNFGYFSSPGDRNFAGDMRAIAPPPKFAEPSLKNFPIPGTTNMVPAFVTQGPTGSRVQPVPRNALPEPEDAGGAMPARPILTEKGELLGYTVKTGPQTFSHKWLADMDSGLKQQIKNNDLEIRELIRDKHTIEKESASVGGSPEAQSKIDAKTAQIRELQQKNIALATGARQPQASKTGEQSADIPDAPMGVHLRRVGQTYKTPKGVFKWTGSGWETK